MLTITASYSESHVSKCWPAYRLLWLLILWSSKLPHRFIVWHMDTKFLTNLLPLSSRLENGGSMLSEGLINCIWNVMAHGDAREEKWRGNKRMEWVTSKRHMTAEHGLARAVQTLQADVHSSPATSRLNWPHCRFNPLKPELNPICYLLALLGAHHFLHISRIRVKLLTLRWLMSYIYGAPILDVSRSHTTTQHSR